MGIHSIANLCSHLQNASKARLGLTSVPNTKYNLRLCVALHRSGFLSSVTRGGSNPPAPEELLAGTPESVVTHANVATRRLWVGLKYWNNEPVLKSLQAQSKPSRLITLSWVELNRVARGFPERYVKGLTLGECLFLSTDKGVMEAREALERRVGGLILCRVN